MSNYISTYALQNKVYFHQYSHMLNTSKTIKLTEIF